MSSLSTAAYYGMSGNASDAGEGNPPTRDILTNGTGDFISVLSSLKSKGARCVMKFVGGPTNYTVNQAFSFASWKARQDIAFAKTSPEQIGNFVQDGTLLAANLNDDIGPAGVFPAGPPTFNEIESMASYTKSQWSNLPCTVRATNTYLKTLGSHYTYLDFGWAQWTITAKQAALTFFQNNVNDGKAVGLGCMGGFNLLDGGSGLTAPWNQHPGTSTKFGMSPQEINAVGLAISQLTTILGINGWSIDPVFDDTDYFHFTGINEAITAIFNPMQGRAIGPINFHSGSQSTSGSTQTVATSWGILGVGNTVFNAGNNPQAINTPSGGTLPGNLLLVLSHTRDNSLRSSQAPSGFSEAARISNSSGTGGSLALYYRITDGTEGTTISVPFQGPGGTGICALSQAFCFQGENPSQANVLSRATSFTSWGPGGSGMSLRGPAVSAHSDALAVICEARCNWFDGNNHPLSTVMSASTDTGVVWVRGSIQGNGTGDNQGFFLDYAFTSGLPSIVTKAYNQTVNPSGSTLSGSGCGFVVFFRPVSVQGGQPPVLPDIVDFTIPVGSLLSFPLTSTGSTPFTFSKTSGPAGCTVDSTTGLVNFTVPSVGTYVIGVSVTNSFGADADEFQVFGVATAASVVSGAPVVTNPGDMIVAAQHLLSFGVSATDPDSDPLTYALDAGAPTGAFMDRTTGQFVWIPSGEQGPGVYPITVVVSDGQNESRSTFTVTVTDSPWTSTAGPRHGPGGQNGFTRT